MKSEYKVWYNSGAFFVKSFPKRNTTLIWDDTNKTYTFHKGVIEKIPKKNIKYKKNTDLITIDYKWIIIGALSGMVLGLTFSILNIFI